MAFKRLKLCNGRYYWCIQKSIREGKKVRSEIVHWIGPATPAEVTAYQTQQKQKQEAKALSKVVKQAPKKHPVSNHVTDPGSKSRETPERLPRASTYENETNPFRRYKQLKAKDRAKRLKMIKSHSAHIHRVFARAGHILKPKPKEHTNSLIHNRSDLRRLNPDKVNKESKEFHAILQAKGASVQGTIKIKWGAELRQKRSGKNVTIFCPNKVNTAQLKKEISRAQSRLAIDALRKNRPTEFKQLAQQAKQSFAYSKHLYGDALLTGHDLNKKFKAISAALGNYTNLERNFKNAEAWGITFEKQRSWEDEITALYATAQSHGNVFRYGKALRREEQKAHRITQHLEGLRKPNKTNQKLENDIQRSKIQAEILKEHHNKLNTINSLFGSNYSDFSPLKS